MLYIGIDLGTSAVKLLLMDGAGQIKKIVSKEYPIYFPHPGFYSRELIFDVISRILSCRPLEEFGSSCSTFFRA
mgnify:CR=1 FL=1